MGRLGSEWVEVKSTGTMNEVVVNNALRVNDGFRVEQMQIELMASMKEVVIERLQTEVGVSINGLVGAGMQAERLVGDGLDVSGVGTMNRLLGNRIRVLGGFNPERLEVEAGSTLNELVVRDGLGVGLTATITGLVGNGLVS